MITVTAIIVIGLTAGVFGVDEEGVQGPSSQEECGEGCGPYFCQARCVASCLDTGLTANIDECIQKYCADFNENTPCLANDTKCWKTCGFEPTLDEQPPPSAVENLEEDYYKDGFSSSSRNPYTVAVQWSAAPSASLYIVETLPMFETEPTGNDQSVKRVMTSDTSYSIPKDLCTANSVQVTAVNSFGVSPMRSVLFDVWKPQLHYDENFDVKSISREGDIVNVQIKFSPPEPWREGDAELESSTTLARFCQGPINDSIFLSAKPDEDGFYTPLVFENDNGTSITLSFPADIMHSQCQFSYRLVSLRTRCNVSSTMDPKGVDGAGVDFSISCQSVENSGCEVNDLKNTVSSEEKSAEEGEVAVVAEPEAVKEGENSAASEERTEMKTESSRESSEEVEEEPLTTTTVKANSGEVIAEGAAASSEELVDDDRTTRSTTRGYAEPTTESNSILEDSKEQLPSPSDSNPANSDNVEVPIIVIVEPIDPNVPVCKMAEFNAEVDSPESKEQETADLVLSWIEERVPMVNAPQPKYFLIRYGPVSRTLVVDPQPEFIPENILRTPSPSHSSEEVSRVFKIAGLAANTLYAFQICAIYETVPDQFSLWDMADKYVVDLAVPSDDSLFANGPSMPLVPQSVDAPSVDAQPAQAPINGSDFDLMDFFFDVMNSSFDALPQVANESQAQPTDYTYTDQSLSDDMMGESKQWAPDSDESASDEDMGDSDVLVVPREGADTPTVLTLEMKPVMVEDKSSSWKSLRAFWFVSVLFLMAIMIAAVLLCLFKRARGRRIQWYEKHQIQPNLASAFSLPHTTTAGPEVKIPVP